MSVGSWDKERSGSLARSKQSKHVGPPSIDFSNYKISTLRQRQLRQDAATIIAIAGASQRHFYVKEKSSSKEDFNCSAEARRWTFNDEEAGSRASRYFSSPRVAETNYLIDQQISHKMACAGCAPFPSSWPS